MARGLTSKNKSEKEQLIPVEETTVEKTTVSEVEEVVEAPTDEVIFTPEIEQKSAVKTVRVMPSANHRCSIGGIMYDFKKGVQVNVPQEVKDILMKSGLLMPL